MIININQKKISVGDKYQIYVDDIPAYKAKAKLFRFLPEIGLYKLNPEELLMKLKRRFSFFVAKYDITDGQGSVFEFRTVSFWRAHYICQHAYDQYEIYRHRGRKCSVYKNRTQVACWDKKAVTWFEGDNYRIEADADVNQELIIMFCLILDNYASNSRGKSAVNFNIGRIGPQAREFNPRWEPKT